LGFVWGKESKFLKAENSSKWGADPGGREKVLVERERKKKSNEAFDVPVQNNGTTLYLWPGNKRFLSFETCRENGAGKKKSGGKSHSLKKTKRKKKETWGRWEAELY